MTLPISIHHFAAGTRSHGVVVLATALAALCLIRVGQRLADAAAARPGWRSAPRRFARLLGGGMLAVWLAVLARDLLPDRRGWAESLPLHLCDVAGLVGAAALYTGRRPLRAVLHLWAFTFTVQAFLMPVVKVGPARMDFWLYWVSHGAIVAAAAYDATVLGFRPRWADWRTAVLATLAYVAVVLPVDAALGANYGYVGDTGGARQSLVAAFGPWPGRVPVLVAAAAAVMAGLTLPWELAAAWGRRRQDAVGVLKRPTEPVGPGPYTLVDVHVRPPRRAAA
ncbi:MAG: Integral rane protein [Phycisphaerales bacterium]|nr:Integral rane protein [Phycisphaerales bacterium]